MDNKIFKENNITNEMKVKRGIKYVLMGLVVLVATRYIPDKPIETKEILMIGLVSSISFGILDMYSPSFKVVNNY